MSDKKKQIITGVTLALIATSSALLIGLSNLATKSAIAKNEKKKINDGIVEIFGENAKIGTTNQVAGDYKYLSECYTVVDNNDVLLGYAYRTDGSNLYGKISLIVGFSSTTHNFIATSIVVDEQTYASTLEENYIDPLNAHERELIDTSCGATYGAKLVKAMIDEAKQDVENIYG